MLHLIAFAPDNSTLLAQSGSAINAGDDLVLLDAGKAFCSSAAAFKLLEQSAGEGVNFYLLGENVDISLPVKRIDNAGLVLLTEQHSASLSWYP